LHLWVRSVTSPELGYFSELPGGQLCPNSGKRDEEIFFALGKAVGKALFETILNDTRFSEVFLARVLGRPWSVDELEEIDPDLHRNLLALRDMKGCESLGLTFSAAVDDGSGMLAEVDLIENGRSVAVDDSNKIYYLHKLAKLKVVGQMAAPARAFSQGMAEIVSIDALRLFSPSELQLLMAGEERRGFDTADLAKFTHYNGYGRLSTTVLMFWQVVEQDFSPEDQSALLSFVTSSPRAPLLGFRVLSPLFTIQKVPDRSRLPTASTCVNLLKLPDYEDRHVLRDKLLQAIHSGAGFDFS
jgi:ubiquitin-protein ligase E3 C